MAFDTATRGRLQTFVTKARLVLTDEFTKQFQQDFGLDPNSGTVSPLDSLAHLDDQRLATARLLREIFDHYLPAAMSSGAEARKATLDRMVREQAFTTLNRLAALRMMEARGLVRECVGKAYQSQAFQLYQRVAGTALGETGDAYRVFLLSLCDVYCLDLPVLFDRHFPNGRLFPQEPALLPLLELINAPYIAPLWAEDETIGWIYQYFNSKDERKAMRDASHAPRNSRELAVRNQFFTPRYVVEFLVDNTLGLLWFNWTGGQTGLRDRCQYLLVKPNERPKRARRLRDPRTIKLLDPACGSMHFGLYAFDLFQDIYREAWDWERAHGLGGLDRETSGGRDLKPLTEAYADRDAFLRDVPRLIIQHNIYGVDIDPRAAQIASLALWLRAQRAWHQAGVKAKDRPQVGQGHVVAAVTPPGEVDLRKRFMEELDPLDAELFEQTLFMLKGLPELGVLLQVEKELPALIRKVFGEHGELFEAEDKVQWDKAEARLRDALNDYARTTRSTYQGRLFAEDALQGLRMIDHCREVFDVVVMNPPFGLPTSNTRAYLEQHYSGAHSDIYTTFVRRARQIARSGFIGCITSSSFLLYPRLEDFRREIIPNLRCVCDLGLGVMDDAMVRAAIYVLDDQQSDFFWGANAKALPDRIGYDPNTRALTQLFNLLDKDSFVALPQARLLIDAPPEVRTLLANGPYLEPLAGTAREGMKTFDNERFLRLPWEVRSDEIGGTKKWRWLTKGGEFSYFYSEIHLVLNWASDGSELKTLNIAINGSTSQVRQASTYWGLPGATYSKRASGFSARVLPESCIFSSMGPAVLPLNGVNPLYLLGWLNSAPIRALTHLNAGAYDNYTTGALKRLPWKSPSPTQENEVTTAVSASVLAAMRCAAATDECSRWFIGLPLANSLSETHSEMAALIQGNTVSEKHALDRADSIVSEVYALANLEWTTSLLKEEDADQIDVQIEEATGLDVSLTDVAKAIASYAVGIAFGRWSTDTEGLSKARHAALSPLAIPPPSPPGASGGDTAAMPTEPGLTAGLEERVRDALALFSIDGERLYSDVVSQLHVDALARYIDTPTGFFADHLAQYSKSKRQAPIYWPISTSSGSYTIWIYYPKLRNQTLYTAVNDFIEPKLKQVAREAVALRDKGTARSRDDEKAFEALQIVELELIELRDNLLQIAPTYRPNRDDGVQITASPLWQLFRHKPWQKSLKDTWAKLEKGDYDWTHLAMAYWPQRVREKCKTDKSLAIAHDLEQLYVEPAPKPANARGRKGAGA